MAPRELVTVPRTTVSGRIVYNRKIHFFTVRDVARIAGKIPDPDTIKDTLRLGWIIVQLVQSLVRGVWANLYGMNFHTIFPIAREIILALIEAMLEVLDSTDLRRENLHKVRALLSAL